MNSVTRKKLEKRCAQFETGAEEVDDIREELLRLQERLEKIKQKCSLRYYPPLLKVWKHATRELGHAESTSYMLHGELEDKASDLEEKLLRDRD